MAPRCADGFARFSLSLSLSPSSLSHSLPPSQLTHLSLSLSLSFKQHSFNAQSFFRACVGVAEPPGGFFLLLVTMFAQTR